MVEKWFHGSPGSFQGIRVYIEGRSRSGELRGADEGGGRALLPRDRLIASLTSSPSLLACFRSKKDHRRGFILFGLCLIFFFCETLKQGKKLKLALAVGSGLIG